MVQQYSQPPAGVQLTGSRLSLTPQQQMAMQAAYQQMQQQLLRQQPTSSKQFQLQQQQQQRIVQQQQQIHGPAAIYNEFMRMGMVEDWFLEGGHKNRILLALRSNLPNEIDWAFNKLVLLSFMAPDHFQLAMIPGIVEAILEHSRPFFVYMNQQVLPYLDPNAVLPSSWQSITDQLFAEKQGGSDEQHRQMERTLQIFHIIRNFSFVDANIPVLASYPDLLRLISLGIRAQGFLKSSEIRLYALDTLENVSVQVKLRDGKDLVYAELKRMLMDKDRGIILGALRTLGKLVHLEQNQEVFSDVDESMIRRLMQLLFVWDEELVSSTMDLLYHYTCLYGSVPVKIASAFSCNIVPVLLKFLEWRAQARPFTSASATPNIQLRHQACVDWLRQNYQLSKSEDASIELEPLYEQYSEKMSLDAKQMPLSYPEFIVTAKMTFAAETSQVNLIDRQLLLMGVIAKEAAFDTMLDSSAEEGEEEVGDETVHEDAVDEELADDNEEDGEGEQSETESMEVDIESGIGDVDSPRRKSLRNQRQQNQQQKNESPKNKAPQNDSQSTSQAPSPVMTKTETLATSFSTNSRPQSAPKSANIQVPQPQHQQQPPPKQPEQPQSSIPLTCALVLRNLAQAKQNRHLFIPYESDLVQYCAFKQIHESVTKVVGNILFELAIPDQQ